MALSIADEVFKRTSWKSCTDSAGFSVLNRGGSASLSPQHKPDVTRVGSVFVCGTLKPGLSRGYARLACLFSAQAQRGRPLTELALESCKPAIASLINCFEWDDVFGLSNLDFGIVLIANLGQQTCVG